MTSVSIFADKNKKIDLPSFIDSRCCVMSNSGGGKSYLIRKILEETHTKVMSIILDVEGEFKTLREKFDFLLIGQAGDIPLNIKSASLLPRKLLELNVSTIIDISDFKRNERVQYMKRFLEALMELPKEYWKPCLIVIDEAHSFCGQQEKQDSCSAVIELMSRGRKRGFCGILATQRISKLHKDAVAEANNYMVGRTGLDVDMKRVAEILGFTSKQDMLSLRDLEPGEFYVFGPAISRHVEKAKISPVVTTHPKVGMDVRKHIAQPTAKIKEILQQLTDLPKEAEQQSKNLDDLRRENNALKKELAQKPAVVPTIDENKILDAFNKGYREAYLKYLDVLRPIEERVLALNKATDAIYNHVGVALQIAQNIKFPNEEIKPNTTKHIMKGLVTIDRQINPQPIPREMLKQSTAYSSNSEYGEEKVSGGALEILHVCTWGVGYAMFGVTKEMLGVISGLSYKSGTFGTYLAMLKRQELIYIDEGGRFKATEKGLKISHAYGNKRYAFDEVFEKWTRNLGGGMAKLLEVLKTCPKDASYSKEALGNEAGMSYTSGTFGTYLATLKRNALIRVEKNAVKLAWENFPE